MNYHLTCLMILSLCLGMCACGQQTNRANLLDPQVKYRSDTMFAHRRLVLIAEQDSLCLLREGQILQSSIDSILTLNQSQIDAILNRSKQ